MATPRFFIDQPLQAGVLTLPPQVAHHLRVRRLAVGDAVQLFSDVDPHKPQDTAWDARITCIDPAQVMLVAPTQSGAELIFRLVLAQALVEPSKMDWLIEKAVELGASEVWPIAAARSVTKLDADRAAKRRIHWRGIAIAASEQCGRNRLMQIHSPSSMGQALSASQAAPAMRHLLLHPQGGMPLVDFCKVQPAQDVVLWVGPEGGWSDAELKQLEAAGAQRVTFGERVLRTETAGLAVAAALQALWF